jgi:hypothetical protein
MNHVSQSEPLKFTQVVLFSLSKLLWICTVFALNTFGVCEASILHQSNFENDKRASWDTFVTPNGTLGEVGWPTVDSFETAKEGQESKALKFKVGQVRYASEIDPEQGGGLVFQIMTETGRIELSANIAVTYHSPKDKRNLAGGLFKWIVDEHVIASHDMGPIDNGGVLRHHLKGEHFVQAGLHTIRLGITRPFTSHPGQHAPFQYVDDLLIRFSPQQ